MLILNIIAFSQNTSPDKVVITGARFSYPLIEHWITRYKAVRPETQVVIQTRTNTDPAGYDILVEGYEHEENFRATRDYLFVAQYAVIPFANSASPLIRAQSDGLTSDDIKHIFFHDPLSERKVSALPNVTVYTRLQKAAASAVFAAFYGYTQQNIKGKSIGGTDEHLIKVVQKDTSGVSYSPINLLYDMSSKSLLQGLAPIPVDMDGNKKITVEERSFTSLITLIDFLEKHNNRSVPTSHLHLSLPKVHHNTEAIRFLQWVAEHGQEALHEFGFLLPESVLYDEGRSKFLTRAGLR